MTWSAVRASLHGPVDRGWRDRVFASLLALTYTLILLSTVDDLGYARDEGFYFHAARTYQDWFELLMVDADRALSDVDAYWKVNHEHPALIKSSFALSHLLLFDKWKVFASEGTSYRFPAMVLSSLAVGLVYLWGTRVHGRLAGFVAALSLAAMPRFFFHAHLACFDTPVVTMWLLCAYCYWRAMGKGGWRWYLAVGVAFGLALNTKHNSWFLPIVFGVHALMVQLPRVARGIEVRQLRKRALGVMLAMATIGPLLFYATWPWIWHDTAPRLRAYANFHLSHVYYNMEFLGRNYFEPPMPRSYAFVMTGATVPTVTLVLFGVGVVVSFGRDWWAPLREFARRLRRAVTRAADSEAAGEGGAGDGVGQRGGDPATTLLWLLALGVQYAAWLRTTTPIFGGTKHWMTAYPFLVLFAGVGVAALVRLARRAWQDSPLRVATRLVDLELMFVTCALVAPVVECAHAHPWGLTSYSPLVGGAPGGASLGLNRGFWGHTTGSVTGYLNDHMPKRGRLYIHDTAWPAWDMLRRDGRIRPDIRGVWNVAGADASLYHHEKHMAVEEYQAWVVFDTTAPVHVDGLDGVPVIWIYQREPLR